MDELDVDMKDDPTVSTAAVCDTELASDETNYFLHQQHPNHRDPTSEHANAVEDGMTFNETQTWIASGEIYASGGLAEEDERIYNLITEPDCFICGDDLMEQVRNQPFRVVPLSELMTPPFTAFFEDPDCLTNVPDNFLITPFGFYRALHEVNESGILSDHGVLIALTSRFGMVPELIQDEDVIYAEDMEPCMFGEDGEPMDPEYWRMLQQRREFWRRVPGGREYKTVAFIEEEEEEDEEEEEEEDDDDDEEY